MRKERVMIELFGMMLSASLGFALGCVWLSGRTNCEDCGESDFVYRCDRHPYSLAGRVTIPDDALFVNPYTGQPRDARDVFSDPHGHLILKPYVEEQA
jgi:hypothetical protein